MTMGYLFQIPILFILSIAFVIYCIRNKLVSRKVCYFMLCFGVLFAVVGAFSVYIFNDVDVLIDALLLENYRISGKFIFIGYGFILTSILLFFVLSSKQSK